MSAADDRLHDAQEHGRAYPAEGITVRFEARRCIHVGECVRGLPAVFDTARRPWIAADAAPADAVAEVVRRCPSGALTFERHDGGGLEPAGPAASIRREPNGPLHVRGQLRIETPDGVRHVTRATLCACGRSGNAPFCDGSHRGD